MGACFTSWRKNITVAQKKRKVIGDKESAEQRGFVLLLNEMVSIWRFLNRKVT